MLKEIPMKILYAVAVCAATAGPAFAMAADAISPTQALGDQGNNVKVEALASVRPATGSRDGVEIALRSGDNSAVVIGYIPKGNVDRFPDLNALNGRIIDISGVLEMDSGQAEIRVTSPDQLAIAQ
jgi:uncharacterized protein YdeI (BOF family)